MGILEFSGLFKSLKDKDDSSGSTGTGSNIKKTQLRQAGRRLMLDDLQRALAIQRGEMQPWELPEYKPLVEGMRTQSERGLSGLTTSLQQAGVTGPAAALTLERAQDQGENNVLDFTKNLQSAMRGEVSGATTMGAGYDKVMAQVQEQANARKAQETAARNAMTQSYVNMGLGGVTGALSAARGASSSGGCCWIFMADDALTDDVRAFRDIHFSPTSLVAKGYKMMANWLVPKMVKSKVVRQLVRWSMLKPLSAVATQWAHGKKINPALIPIALFWCILWEMMARVKGVMC